MSHDHGPTDSAQVPWAGRDLSPSGFEADTGAADPLLQAALAGPADDLTLMRAVEASRFVVPVVAEPTEVDTTGEHVVEKQVDMAAVTLVAPDGQRALPVFTGTDALAAWDPDGPTRAGHPGAGRPGRGRPRGATSSSSTSPAPRPGCCGPRWSGPWPSSVPGSRRTPTRSSTAASRPPCATRTTSRPTSSRRATRRGEGVLGVVLDLEPGLTPEQVRAVATRVGERLATDGELRARIDGLAFRLR